MAGPCCRDLLGPGASLLVVCTVGIVGCSLAVGRNGYLVRVIVIRVGIKVTGQSCKSKRRPICFGQRHL